MASSSGTRVKLARIVFDPTKSGKEPARPVELVLSDPNVQIMEVIERTIGQSRTLKYRFSLGARNFMPLEPHHRGHHLCDDCVITAKLRVKGCRARSKNDLRQSSAYQKARQAFTLLSTRWPQ